MKKVFTIVLILFTFNANSQFKEAESGIFAKYKKGKVYDKNGNSIEGLIKKRNISGIKFKKSDNDAIKYYDYRHISGFEISEKYRSTKYEYKKLENGNFYLMKVEMKGKMCLYSISGEYKNAYSALNNTTDFLGGIPYINYYIENNGITIKIDRKFNKSVDGFFEDCPRLIEHIRNGKYGKIKKIHKGEKIRQIVFYYNRCAKNGA